jgi:hypothetical protein
MRKIQQILVLLFISTKCLLAQTGTTTLIGVILDVKNQAIPGSVVSLLKSTDSTLFKAIIADASGKFQFKNTPVNRYLIRVTSVGLGTYFSPIISIDSTQKFYYKLTRSSR